MKKQKQKQMILIVFMIVTGTFSCGKIPVSQNRPTSTLGQAYAMNRSILQNGIREIFYRSLVSRGVLTGQNTLNVFDFDHTLANTTTAVPVYQSQDPDKKILRTIDSKCMVYDKKNESADFSVFEKEDTLAFAPILESVVRFEKYINDPEQSAYVITARSAARTYTAVYEFLWKHAELPDGVIAVNSASMQERVWSRIALPQGWSRLPSGADKPLLIAALLELSSPSGEVKTVRYFEDTDKYFNTGAEFLAERFPGVRFEFYDYVRDKNTFTEMLALVIENGKILPQNGFVYPSYDSGDCPK